MPYRDISTHTVAHALAQSDWQSYCSTSIRHADKSESEIHTRPLAGESVQDWQQGIVVWRVMRRAPHDKRRRSLDWPPQVILASGFAYGMDMAERAGRTAIKNARS